MDANYYEVDIGNEVYYIAKHGKEKYAIVKQYPWYKSVCCDMLWGNLDYFKTQKEAETYLREHIDEIL